MGRKNQVIAGTCLLVAIFLWGAHRAGVFRGTTSHAEPTPLTAATVTSPAAPSAPATAPAANNAPSLSTSASTLNDSDPLTFVALRYDKTHVVFRVAEEFGLEDPETQEKMLHPLQQTAAEYGGYIPSEIEPGLFESLKQNYKSAQIGELWQLEIAPGVRMPFTIQKPVEMAWDCSPNSYAAGFIAEVTPEFQAAFSSAPQKYFIVHKAPPASGSSTATAPPHVGELKDWTPTPEVKAQIEQAVTEKMKAEIAKEQTHRWAYYHEEKADQRQKADFEASKHFADQAAVGRGKLTYDFQAFQLSPDAEPRLLLRARWMSEGNDDQAFLESFWLRIGSTLTIEHNEQDATSTMWMARGGEIADEEFRLSNLETVVSVFDKADGYADLLIFSPGYEGYSMTLYRYTAAGLSPTTILNSDGC